MAQRKTSGHPIIQVKFYKRVNVTDPFTMMDVSKQFTTTLSYTLHKFAEAPEVAFNNETVITLGHLKGISDRIHEQFLPSPDAPYEIKRGAQIWTYQCFPFGYRLWCPLLDEATAREVYGKLLATRPDTLNDRWLRHSVAANQASYAFNEKITVLGEEKLLPGRGMEVEIPFLKAWCNLPISGQRVTLASMSGKDGMDDRLKEIPAEPNPHPDPTGKSPDADSNYGEDAGDDP